MKTTGRLVIAFAIVAPAWRVSAQATCVADARIAAGPGTIAVMISLGLSRSAYSDGGQDLQFFVATLLATLVIALTIYLCFAYSDRVQRGLGIAGTDILVRLTAFILFCLGVQIVWTGASELLSTVVLQKSAMTCLSCHEALL